MHLEANPNTSTDGSLNGDCRIACKNCNQSLRSVRTGEIVWGGDAKTRAEILSDEYLKVVCPNCGMPNRPEPNFNYVDSRKKIWISAFPLAQFPNWRTCQATALRHFSTALTQDSIDLKLDMKCRIAFGWAAFREKVLAAEFEIDDIDIELAKAAILREGPKPPVGITALRLVAVTATEYLFNWFDLEAQEPVGQAVSVSKTMFAQIKTEPAAWAELRKEIDSGIFIDILKFITA